MSQVLDKLSAIAAEVASDMGYVIYDVELLGGGSAQLLRITLEKEGGVSVDDCAEFSRQFGALMDVEDVLKGRYTLEVSSPGLDRKLRKPDHYRKALGKLAKVVFKGPVEGRAFVVARIEDVDDGGVRLLLDGEEPMYVGYDKIKKARLEAEI